jgi:hypothetical protein
MVRWEPEELAERTSLNDEPLFVTKCRALTLTPSGAVTVVYRPEKGNDADGGDHWVQEGVTAENRRLLASDRVAPGDVTDAQRIAGALR